MVTLITNEFRKLKREWFLFFVLLLTMLPVGTGIAGAFLNDGQKSLEDLFFFINNQYAMFFPMVVFILIGSLFYQEYKNRTYINWITYGYPKSFLFFSKVLVGIIMAFLLALIMFLTMITFSILLINMGKITTETTGILDITVGFFLETLLLIPITICAGTIVINMSRNIIITSILGMIYGFVSCFFIGSEQGFWVPGGFAYRTCMYFVDNTSYYENPSATLLGTICTLCVLALLLLVGFLFFTRKRMIEE